MVIHRFAKETDIASLTEIWRLSFSGDTKEQIAAFLQTVDLSRECLVAEGNGAVVSMVFMLPAVLKTDVPLPLQYIYAAATLPSHRGRGLFGALLRQALYTAREQGMVASFLHPAEPSLCGYYARFGYRPFFYCNCIRGTAKASPLTVRSVTAQEYLKQRERWQPPFSVEWPARFLENTVSVGDGCAVCVSSGSVLYIYELFCEDKRQTESCEALATHFGCTTYEARVPATEMTKEPFGLLCPLRPFNREDTAVPYMGVALD